VAERAAQVAGRHGGKPSQIALAWLVGKPGVTAPVLGATRPEHVDEAVAALQIKLTGEDVSDLEELYQPHPLLGHEGPPPGAMGNR
jgi:aryl-alcohol dehydrogenase-like predicted oxidoreductase